MDAYEPEYESSRNLRPGTRIGSSLVVRGVLGEGGTAVVYEAFDTRRRSSVAVKMLRVAGAFAGEARARLLREAQICAAIEDPHIPRVFDVDELADGTPYLVMEKVDGAPLSRLLRQGSLPIRRSCDIVVDLLDALTVIHERGILHRDVKPGNLIVEPRRRGKLGVRLMDFGVGKLVMRSPEATSITRQGEVIGTPCYMAPEQLMGHALDERVDVYAAGIVLYEMLTGRAPYEAQSVGEVVAAVLRDEIGPVRLKRPDVPPALAVVVAKATAKHPSIRYASARAMRAAVVEAATHAKCLKSVVKGRDAAPHATALRLTAEDAESERPTLPRIPKAPLVS